MNYVLAAYCCKQTFDMIDTHIYNLYLSPRRRALLRKFNSMVFSFNDSTESWPPIDVFIEKHEASPLHWYKEYFNRSSISREIVN